MLLEVTAQDHQRLCQQPPPVLSISAAISSRPMRPLPFEGVDGFELSLDQSDPDQRRQVGVGGVDEALLLVRQQIGHLL